MLAEELQGKRDGPYPYYGLEVDEATDVANRSIMVVFIRFINQDGELEVRFLGVQDLQMTDADSLFASTRAVMDSQNLPLDKMTGLATDGASVMVGCHKGVATQYVLHSKV